MACILRVLIIDGGDETIKVGHEFYGVTETECRTYMREHLHSCEYFKSAHDDGRLIEEVEEVDPDELPEAEADEEEEEEYESET
jgi:hypothetical protein